MGSPFKIIEFATGIQIASVGLGNLGITIEGLKGSGVPCGDITNSAFAPRPLVD
jgi:hypothetical protein